MRPWQLLQQDHHNQLYSENAGDHYAPDAIPGRKAGKLARADWVQGFNAQNIPRLAAQTSRQIGSILTENVSGCLERFAQIAGRLPSLQAASDAVSSLVSVNARLHRCAWETISVHGIPKSRAPFDALKCEAIARPRAPIPKFASNRSDLRCELRNQRSSSNFRF